MARAAVKSTKSEPVAGLVLALCASGSEPQALLRLLKRLKPSPDMAVLIVLRHREALDEDVLKAATQALGISLVAIVDGAVVQAGAVYLPLVDVIVELEGGRFQVRPADSRPGERGTIDSLLVSMARSEDGSSIAVLFGGTGDDGTLGVAAIKEAGGLALAEAVPGEDAETLATSSHPAALADFVLPVDDLADKIEEHVRTFREAAESPPPAETAAALKNIAGTLRGQTGHDFHGYKAGTFLRRVQRRMQVVQIDTLAAYSGHLRANAQEAQSLFNDLLIGVTQFFRDKREFDLIESKVIPALFKDKNAADHLRIWVIGCSTGEEAYSLAILLREHMAKLDVTPQVQIFATDIDGRALASARAGRYTGSIVADMPTERLARWFVREGSTYCIAKELREMVIFSQHSIIKDAPFSRLDMVSCRNLLIYLDVELQSRVIPLFHFALKQDGFLFLGNSENVSRHTKLFAPVEPRYRVFRRQETGTRVLPDFPFTSVDRRFIERASRKLRPEPQITDLARRAERIVERHVPAHVIVDDQFNVLHFSGRTGRFIDPAGGTASLNLLTLSHPDLRQDLRSTLQSAAATGRTAQTAGLAVGDPDGSQIVDLTVEPLDEVGGPQRGFIVIFKEAASAAPVEGAPRGPRDSQIERLESQLRDANERLQATIEELESTNEELKSSNEEYQSLNEELQSANEELETSKEELQSVNEELTTVNGELGHRVHELGRANSDLKNLLESTQIATVFLDNELTIMNYTPAVAEIFHLVDTDIGRPITHIKSRITYDELTEDVRRVLRTLGSVEREVESDAGARYIVRVLPYRSVDNFIRGVVVTFVDTTPITRAQAALKESEARFRTVADLVPELLWSNDPSGFADWHNRRWLDYTGQTPGQALAKGWQDVIHPEDLPASLKSYKAAVQRGQPLEQQHRIRGSDGDYRWFLVRAEPVFGQDGGVIRWFGAAVDIHDQRAAFDALAESELRLRTLIQGMPQLVWRSDNVGNWTWASAQWLSFTGQTQEQTHGRGWIDPVHPEDRERAAEAWKRAQADGMLDVEFRIRRASDGAYFWHHTRSVPVRDPSGRTVEWLGTCTDVQQLKELQERQAVLVAELQHRTRNLIGVVRSVAEKTLTASGTLDDFAATFRDRIAALARVQGLLSRLNEGDRVAFGELLRTELAAHGVGPDGDGRVTLDGPENVRLRSATVQTLALALHELATNASKYGALGQPAARLEVRWWMDQAEPVLHVHWLETGVDVPANAGQSERKGYGRELIERALPYQLGAKTSYEIAKDGVKCTLSIPIGNDEG